MTNLLLRFLVLTIVLGSTISPVFSQEGPRSYEAQLVPPNPDISTLGSFGDIPVNKYNGTANISIPIHTIDLDGLQIPLSLIYNTGGVRVNQDASWVGLGWNLSEGMTITRQMHGFEDIKEGGSSATASVGWIYSTTPAMHILPQPGGPYDYPLNFTEIEALEQEYGGITPRDTEPDIFTVSLPSGSCRFYLPRISGGATTLIGIVMDEKGYKVEYDVIDRTFEITDRNGFLFTFDVIETSTGFNTSSSTNLTSRTNALSGITYGTGNTKYLVTSWKVSKVTSPQGNILNFTHLDGFYFSYPHYEEQLKISVNSNNLSVAPLENNFTVSSPYVYASLSGFHVKYLTSISGDFGSLTFNLENREDLFSKQDKARLAGQLSGWEPLIDPNVNVTKRLGSIDLKDDADSLVKTVQFDYDYFNNHMLSNVDKVSHIRLKLDGVTIQDQEYTFEYNNPNSLAKKDSDAIDFWGFYNGVNNSVRVPSSNRFALVHGSINSTITTFERFFKVSGADRGANVDFGKYGNLRKITYPTKGYTEFEYQGHEIDLESVRYTPSYFPNYLDPGIALEFRSSQLFSTEDYNHKYQHLKLADNPGYSLFDESTCLTSTQNLASNNSSVSFTISSEDASICNGQSNVSVISNVNCSGSCCFCTSGNAVWIKNTGTSAITVLRTHGSTQGSQSHEFNLAAGNYQLISNQSNHYSTADGLSQSLGSATATVLHDVSTFNTVTETFQIGGSRIRKITNKDSDGTFIDARTFEYDGGKLMDDLVFTSMAGLFDYSPQIHDSGQTLTFSSDNKIRNSPSAMGSHVGYDEVIERQENQGSISKGRMVTKYHNQSNDYFYRYVGSVPQMQSTSQGSIYDVSAYTMYYLVSYGNVHLLENPAISYGYINGKLLEEEAYDISSTNPLRKTVNTYEELNNDFSQENVNFGPHHYLFPKMLWGGSLTSGNFLVGSTHVKRKLDDFKQNYTSRIKSSEVTETYGGGSVIRNIEYFYDNPYWLATKTVSNTSDGKIVTSKFYYPEDLNITSLVTANRFATQVKSESFEGSAGNPEETKLFTEETTYATFGALVLPSEINTKRGNTGTEYERILYERYDAKGNLVQYRRSSDGMPTTFLWSYNREYPVAKIENATLAEVATALSVSETTLLNFQNLSTLNGIRTALPNAMVYTYTYIPLVGIETVTDPNGLVTTYEYDTENRLKLIRDNDLNILSQNEYNYGN